ncbi:MAG: hypothetical protein IKM08_03660, partial [Clostridia bacterium]|nr:hypothetical protein [Clostridia bacterium]
MDALQIEELEKIEGTIEEVVYHNEENGYTVLILECTGHQEPVTAVGELPFAAEGERIAAMGRWTVHATYGRQFRIEYYEKELPTGKEAMLRYLSSRAVKGIGPATARKIVEVFGEEYAKNLRAGLCEKGWVDVFPCRGKRGGAFSSGGPGTEPYIL